ncbi:MAG TPA: hypothetical protein VGM44_24270, partial [Polyangiaceae bacterium]
ELGSPRSALLPAGFPMLVVSLLGLPPLCADSFDPETATVGAIARDVNGELGWVLAVHTLSGPELVAKLSTGAHAPFRALPSESRGLTLLQSATDAGAKQNSDFALGVFDNYLLVASNAETLRAVGPYVARMLPKKPAPKAGLGLKIAQKPLANALVPLLRAAWAGYRTSLAEQDRAARAAHGGRPADFADPAQAILALDGGVESVLAVLESATALELDVEPFPNRLEASLSVVPAPGSAAQTLFAKLGAGDAKALLALPLETRLAFGSSRSAAERDEAAQSAGDDWVRLLGERLPARDAQTLRSVLADWELGRGTHASYGYVGGAAPGVFVSAEVADAEHLERAIPGFLSLLALPAMRAPLAEFVGQPKVSPSKALHTDVATRAELAKVSFAPLPNHPNSASLPPISCAWFVEDKLGLAAGGPDAGALLEHLAHAARGSAPALGADAEVASAVERMGQEASLFAYADARAGETSADAANKPVPLFLSLGKHADTGFLRLEVTKRALDLALGRLTGF